MLLFSGLTPQGTRQPSTRSEEGREQKRKSANTSYFIAAVAYVRIEAQGKIFKSTFRKRKLGASLP